MASRASGRSGNHKRSRLVSELMSRRMDGEDDDGGDDRFFIRSHNEGFQNRQTSVFDKLNDLENKFSVSAWKEYDPPPCTDDDEEGEHRSGPPVPPTVPTSPEQFKIPIGVAPKRAPHRPAALTEPGSSVPTFSANPDQWTKYSLANITAEFMSEDANTDAAMTFLTSRWKSCSDYEEGGEGSEPVAPPRKLEFGKFLMPEYSVGRPGAKKTAPSGSKANATKSSTTTGSDTPDGDGQPKVKLSFLNAVTDHNVGAGSSRMEEETDDAGGPVESASGDAEPVFRAVRKRKRNIRQASVNHDDGENMAD